MNEPRTLGPWLRRFLAEHVVTERNLARNTQLSYADTFVLLIPFLSARARKPDERLALDDLSPRRVLEFLDHLEDERGCSVQTRNVRLSAIRPPLPASSPAVTPFAWNGARASARSP